MRKIYNIGAEVELSSLREQIEKMAQFADAAATEASGRLIIQIMLWKQSSDSFMEVYASLERNVSDLNLTMQDNVYLTSTNSPDEGKKKLTGRLLAWLESAKKVEKEIRTLGEILKQQYEFMQNEVKESAKERKKLTDG